MSSSDGSTSLKTYVLRSSDGETFVVEEAVAVQSETIKHMIEDGCTDPAIPLPNVTGNTLAKIIEYCQRHVASAARTPPDDDGASAQVDEELKAFDAQYIRVDQDTLYHLLLAANYLNIKNLLELTCQHVVGMIKGKSPEQIRNTFGIENDFTPEEEEAIRKETPWAFEDE